MLGNHEKAYDNQSCVQCLLPQTPALLWEYAQNFLDKNPCKVKASLLKTCENTNYFHHTC